VDVPKIEVEQDKSPLKVSPGIPARQDKKIDDEVSQSPREKARLGSMRRHRFFIMKLDHLIEFVSHPGFLLFVTVAIASVFLITRYAHIAIYTDDNLLLTISNDFLRALTYAAAVFVTYIVTKFLENRKK